MMLGKTYKKANVVNIFTKYPYGKYISNNIQKNMYFPSRIDLSKWCSEKPPCNVSICEPEIVKFEPFLNCNCILTNKKSLFVDK